MKRNCFILTIFIVTCNLFLQVSCQGQAVAGESKLESTPPRATIGPSKARVTKLQTNKKGPKITFEKVIHDFGKIGPGTKNAYKFKFTNTGDKLLKIKRIQSTCGCAVAKLSKKEYAPGESGTLKVTYSSGKSPGAASKRLFVYSNDKARPKVTLTIKAEIVLKVGCKPKRLKLLLEEENAGCPKITLTSLDGQPFSIKRFRSTPNCITADVNSLVKETKFVIQPKVDIEKLRKHSKGRINISLTHPECRMVTITFNTLPRFTINPPVIVVYNAKPQEHRRKEVWILNNYSKDFKVESAASEKGIIKVLSQKKVGNRYKFELQITPPAAKGKRVFADVFYVNIKDGEKLKVRCNGFYSRKAGKVSSTN